MQHVILIGAGPLGLKAAAHLHKRFPGSLAGIVDICPELQGRSLGDIIPGADRDIRVSATIEAALAAATVQPEIAVVTTVSSIHSVIPTIREAAEAGLPVVSTCEELVYPWRRHPSEAAEIDAVCRSHSVACLGTGVNPGFLMDFLPIVLSGIQQRVDHVLVERVQDASGRRIPFQKKIGAGLTLEEFHSEAEAGRLQHVGLPESLDMIAAAFGWQPEETKNTLQPVLSDAGNRSGFRPICAGEPSGVEQVATAYAGGREIIRLRFRASIGEPKPVDRIVLTGTPTLETEIKGGVNGDLATVALTVNAIGPILRSAPGLRTMLDIPVAAWRAHKTRG